MNFAEALQTARAVNQSAAYYRSLNGLFLYDQWTSLPRRGGAYRQEMSAFFGAQKAKLYASDDARRAAAYLDGVSPAEIESDADRAQVRIFRRDYRNAVLIPSDTLREFTLIKTDVLNAWKEAREKRDYRIFMPWLKRAFALKAKIARALEPEQPVFDTLVGMTDEGVKAADVSREFGRLRGGLVSLIALIRSCGKAQSRDFLDREHDPAAVMEFGRRLACWNGLDPETVTFNDRAVHGMTNRPGPLDSRISTARLGRLDMIFTLLHEGGHAMYSSRTDPALQGEGLWGGTTGALQEGAARFYENIVGRSREFWQFHYGALQAALPEFKDLPPEDFYAGINAVSPSLKRTAADEVTYSLHIIVRFELERDYFTGLLKAEELASAWNDAYERTLGLRPADDLEGILQDIHWAGDYIGYFQSYALGNIYGAQWRAALLEKHPDAFTRLAAGDIGAIDSWMQEHLFRWGCSFTSPELMKRVAGSELDAAPYLNYLREKYSRLYGFKI